MALKIVLLVFCFFAFVHAKVSRQSDEAKAELEEYINNKRSEINPKYRLLYHLMPPVGWMNDPNGFSFFNEEYHMFYQFNPYDSHWGPMHWGHYSSKDLVNWKELPTALLPEEEMCYSGSAVVDGDTFVLMYTGHINFDQEPWFHESQYLAFSDDGIDFHKYEGNPVLTDYPPGTIDFRDPKTWKHGDYWYTVIGSQTTDGRGRVLLYRSPDLKTWEFLSVLGESNGDTGYMWECPDFFELNGKYVLLISPQGMEPQGDRYKNHFQTGYIIGDFNYETFEFVPEVPFQESDFGHDFYAAQTTERDGKRYVVAWFSMWEKPYPEAEDGWAGALTIIRELVLADNRILMKPIEAITSLRDVKVFDGELQKDQVLEFGKTAEIIVEGDLDDNIILLLEGQNGGEKAWVRWDSDVGKVVVVKSDDDVRQVEWSPIGSRSWRLFLDSCSLELFCGEGEVVFSTRLYPDGSWRVTNLSSQSLNVEAYSLKRSVPEP